MATRVLPPRVLSRRTVVNAALLIAIVLISLLPAKPAARGTMAGSISGRVTSSTNGLGLQGTALQFFDLGADDFVGSTVTDANGDYTMNLAAGSYAVLTQDNHGHINEIYNNVKCSSTCDTSLIEIIEVATTAITGINFVLDPGGRVAGTVTSSATGLPIPNVRVDFLPTVGDQFPFTSAVTDGSGNYISDAGIATGNVIALTANTQGFRDEVYNNKYCLGCDAGEDGDPIAVTINVTTNGINFVLDPGGRITGTVTDSNATPLAGVAVYVATAASGFLTQSFTDVSGNYATPGLPTGNYLVITENNGNFVDEIYNNKPCPETFCDLNTGDPVSVTSPNVTAGINFALSLGGRISGTVTEAAGGTPLSDVFVGILNSSGQFVTGAQTEANGSYTTGAVPPGVYFATVVNTPGFANQIYNGVPCGTFCNTGNGTPINVVANQTNTNINFALVPAGGITGTVTNASNGTPLSNYQVQLFTSGGLNLGSVQTNASGVYTFSGTTPGSYYVRTNTAGFFVNQLYNGVTCVGCNVTTSGGTLVQVTANVTTPNINFALASGGRISGTITNASGGAPIQNVQAQVFGAGGVGMGTTSTNASGVYSSFGLPAGTYFVRTNNALGFVNELFDNIPCPISNCSVTSGTPIAVSVGATTANVHFALDQGGTIAGTVTNQATGFGIQNVSISVFNNSGLLVGSLNTNASGGYTTSGVPAGNYFVRTTNNAGFLDELYDNIPCAGCTVTTGTPVPVATGVQTSNINFALALGGGSIAGTVTDTAGQPLVGISVRVFHPSGTQVKFQNTNASGQYTMNGLPAGTYYARTGVLNTQPYVDELYNGMPCHPSCTIQTGTPITVVDGATTPGIDFSLAKNLVNNGRFDFGTNNWTLFATPDLTYIVSQIVNGVFEYYRNPPPPGTANQAVIFQNTNVAVPTNTALTARFSLGNSSSVRKRISVLIIEADFSDIAVCTFWIPAGTPMTAYRMHTHTTKAWTNAAIYFYAATPGQNGGFYRLDDVALEVVPGGVTNATECVDPFVPNPPGGVPGPELLVNGNFNTGTPSPWIPFGQIGWQIAAGVFEFIRNPGLPVGVVLQPTGQTMTTNDILTATFQLGNSSAVRKRVTVIMHDNNFSDLSACTFWLAPGQPLSNYAMQMYATQGWSNATLSIYPATLGAEQWIRLDNVTFRKTPAAAIKGTECLEPGASPLDLPNGAELAGAAMVHLTPALRERELEEARTRSGYVDLGTDSAATMQLDLRNNSNARLTLRSWLTADADAQAEVQVSTDGVQWITVGMAAATESWESIDVDLSEFAGQVITVRLVFRSSPHDSRGAAMLWRLGNIALVTR